MSCTIFIRERMDAFTATEARLAGTFSATAPAWCG